MVNVSAVFRSVAAIVNTSTLPNSVGNNAIPVVLNMVFALSASIAVLMIVIGGFRYIMAGGDPSATAQAKNTLLYAIIGLIVVMAAYSIVAFVVKGVG